MISEQKTVAELRRGNPVSMSRVEELIGFLEQAQRERDEALKPRMCSVCAGNGVALSGPCICGGSGLESDEIAGLRKVVFDLQKKCNEAEERVKRIMEAEISEQARLINERDEARAKLAASEAVWAMDRDHEMNGPKDECDCPSCHLHNVYRHKLSQAAAAGAEMRGVIDRALKDCDSTDVGPWVRDALNALASDCGKPMLEERERMRKALEFYADPANWVNRENAERTFLVSGSSNVAFDSGQIAREAVKPAKT